MTQIDEELHFSDFLKDSNSVSKAVRHERVDLTKSGSGRVLRLKMMTPPDLSPSMKVKKRHRKNQRSNVDRVFAESLADKTAAVFSDVASNIFHVGNLSRHKVRRHVFIVSLE